MTNRIIFAVLFLVVTLSASAQRLKFREVVAALDTVAESEQMALLREYIAADADHANANFRLAMLHYRIFRKADPMLEFRKSMAHAKEAALRLLRARLLVTAQEVRSDNEYYAPYFATVDSKGKPYVEFGLVQEKMNAAYDSCQNFQAKMPAIYHTFTKSVIRYDAAVKQFAAINTQFKSMEDLFLLYDNSLEKQLHALKQDYDSSVFYLKHYQSLIAEYPLAKYKQNFHTRNIAVYRLDGLLTRFSFLTPEIELWNYAEWVDGVIRKYGSDIAALRSRIEKTEMQISESIRQLSARNAATVHPVPKDLVFDLNNYDRNSLALGLLQYKSFKQHWANKLRGVGVDSTFDIKLDLYSNLIQLNRTADSIYRQMTLLVNTNSVRKHAGYLTKFYGGETGLYKFMQDESTLIEQSFAQYQDTLKRNLIRYSQPIVETAKTVKIGPYMVPLVAEKKPIATLDNTGLLTLKTRKNPDGSMYLVGVHRMNKKTNNNLMGYVARINPDGKAAWIKDLNYSPDSVGVLDADNYIGDLVTTQEGCGILVTSIKPATGNSVNTFVFANDKGELKPIRLKDAGMARKLIYQEAGNYFVMLFKGQAEKQQYQTAENVSISSINALGDLLWRRDLTFAGTVQDMITVRDGYLLSGNFTSIKDLAGREVKTKLSQDQSNPYLIKLSMRGDVSNILPLVSQKSIYIDRIIKVSDESINLLGYESTFTLMEDAAAVKGDAKHMMTTFNLKRICSNF